MGFAIAFIVIMELLCRGYADIVLKMRYRTSMVTFLDARPTPIMISANTVNTPSFRSSPSRRYTNSPDKVTMVEDTLYEISPIYFSGFHVSVSIS